MNKLSKLKPYLPTFVLVALILFMPYTAAFASGIDEWLYTKVVIGGFGKILAWAGIILDYAINTFVVNFGTVYLESGIGVTIEEVWATVRDLFNLTFIFGLVYIGFKMILRSDDSSTRKWLINIIIAALLINFSLFITKFIIDFSNILAVEIINTGITDDLPSGAPVFASEVGVVKISESMQGAAGIVTVFDDDAPVEGFSGEEADVSMSMIFGTILVFLVASFVYFSAGILLLIRAATLMVLMILSPFLFIGMVLPMFQSTQSQLWSTLFKRAFLAPIYILFLYITIRLSGSITVNGFSGALAATDGADAIGAVAGSFGPYILIMALLIMSLTAAQKLGAEGAGAMLKLGNNIRQRGQRAVKGGARWTAAQTGGRAARYTSNRVGQRLNRGLQNLQMQDGRLGRIARSNAVTGTVGAAASGMQQTKFGMKRTLEEEQKMRNETERKTERGRDAGSDNQAARAAAFGRMGSEELMGMTEEQRQENARHMTTEQIDNLEKEGRVSTEAADGLRAQRENQIFDDFNQTFTNVEASAVQLENAFSGMARAVENIPDERLAEQGDRLTDQNFARHLSNDQMDVLRQNLGEEQFQNVRNARRDGQIEFAATGQAPGAGVQYSSDDANRVAERNRQRLFQNAQRAGDLPAEVFRDSRNRDLITTRAVEERIKNGVSEAELYEDGGGDNDFGIANNIQAHIDDPGASPQERERRARTWRQWSQRSDNAGALGLNTDPPPEPEENAPGIITSASEGDVRRAREDRDNRNI